MTLRTSGAALAALLCCTTAGSRAVSPTAAAGQPAGQPAGHADSQIETLDAVTAPELRTGLGFSVAPRNLWEFQAAKTAGATEVRFSIPWDKVESSPGQIVIPAEYRAALDEVKRLGLQPLVVAAYGPGWKKTATLTVSEAAPVGARTIAVRSATNLADFRLGYDYVRRANGGQLAKSGTWAYPGTAIASADPARGTITLGVPLSVALASGDQLDVNRRAYPPAGNTPDDPSIQAYVHYVRLIAGEIASRGLTGRVEIWNEPPWTNDLWDGGIGCFVVPDGARRSCHTPNFAMARALMDAPPPKGVRWVWSGTSKSGANTIFGPRMGFAPTRAQVVDAMAAESMHPYGDAPEQGFWSPACLRASGADVGACALPGTNQKSNMRVAQKAQLSHRAAQGWSVERSITEAGIITQDETVRARYLLRSYIGYRALGIDRVNFFRLAETPRDRPNYGLVDGATRATSPAYEAFRRLAAELDRYPVAPKADFGTPPTVRRYTGDWPLVVVPVTGRQTATQPRNSAIVILWQRTYGSASTSWQRLQRPNAGSATLTVPTGLALSAAWSLVDGSPVRVQRDQNALVIPVGDDPIAIRLDPAAQ